MSIALIRPAPDSGWAGQRLEDILRYALGGKEIHEVRRAEELDGLEGRRVLLALPLGDTGVSLEYMRMLSRLRKEPGLLRGCTGGLIVDGAGELYTKSAAAEAAGKTLTIHVKVDTGMGRLGFVYYEDDDEAALERAGKEIEALCALPGLEAEGVFTHFANADGSETYTKNQYIRIQDVIGELWDRGLCQFKIYHCAASAAVLNYTWTGCNMNMIRPGIALYGYVPDPSVRDPGLKPVMTVKSRIAAVRELPAGAKISYGCTATLERDSKVAVLPMGYGDGLPRALSNKLEVRIGDKLCPVLGRICMDMCMVDVTDAPGVKTGDVATVYGPGLTDKAAQLAGTIAYELVCRISTRVTRVYWENGAKIF